MLRKTDWKRNFYREKDYRFVDQMKDSQGRKKNHIDYASSWKIRYLLSKEPHLNDQSRSFKQLKHSNIFLGILPEVQENLCSFFCLFSLFCQVLAQLTEWQIALCPYILFTIRMSPSVASTRWVAPKPAAAVGVKGGRMQDAPFPSQGS